MNFKIKEKHMHPSLNRLGLHNASKTFINIKGHCGVSDRERRPVSIGRINIFQDLIILFIHEHISKLDSAIVFFKESHKAEAS
jgi:hypothetical protein